MTPKKSKPAPANRFLHTNRRTLSHHKTAAHLLPEGMKCIPLRDSKKTNDISNSGARKDKNVNIVELNQCIRKSTIELQKYLRRRQNEQKIS